MALGCAAQRRLPCLRGQSGDLVTALLRSAMVPLPLALPRHADLVIGAGMGVHTPRILIGLGVACACFMEGVLAIALSYLVT